MTDRAADAERARQKLASDPRDRVAWHNLAAAEGDLGRPTQAEAAARQAIALGLPAPETRLVLARALQGQRKLDEAQRAFEEAIALRPSYLDAHRELAQLLWMRTGDAAVALGPVEQALRRAPNEAPLHYVKSLVLEYTGDVEAAFAAARAGLSDGSASDLLLRQTAHLATLLGQARDAVALARRALALEPGKAQHVTLCEALVAAGELAEAGAIAAALRAADPLDQYAIALQATIWRLAGDARQATLNDYSLVTAQRLDTPDGWPTLDAFLGEVREELHALHAFQAHPLQQSVRGGSQLPLEHADLERPLLATLFGCIGNAINRHLRQLGTGADPVRSRNRGGYAISGAWSVRLRSGGYHTDHVHPEGWISSACYIALPPAVGRGSADDRAGWLRLGKPLIPTPRPLGPERYVRPEPGLLALFPAYMWHGVEPFESDTPRLSVAFDVVPG